MLEIAKKCLHAPIEREPSVGVACCFMVILQDCVDHLAS